jgi:predicted RNA-binding protein (virulence factor B family)
LHSGLLYANEVFQPLKRGQKIKGYIKKLREDEKIDLSLQKPGYEKIGSQAEKIMRLLKVHNGVLPYGDKSTPESIYDFFQMSKKDFKKALGQIYKQKLVVLEPLKITLI